MSDGFIWWFERDWSYERAGQLVAALERAEWSLTNETTGLITALTSAGQEAVTRDELLRRMALEDKDSVTFQWWLDAAGSDVVHSIDRLPGDSVAHDFDLVGDMSELNRIVRDVYRLATADSDRTIGAVFDRFGASLDLDWESVMNGQEIVFDEVPNMLVLSPDLARQQRAFPYRHQTYHADGVVIYDWAGLYPGIAATD